MKNMKTMKVMINVKKGGFLVFLSVFTFCLSGCANMNGTFDCNVGSGGKCTSMNNVNKMADYGAFHDSRTPKKSLARAKKQAFGYPPNTHKGALIRSNEKTQQIWIGPYEDVGGNYHEPSYVHTVLKKGRWIGKPPRVIQD